MNKEINRLHAVSRIMQGRQREPCVKTISADFLRENNAGLLATMPKCEEIKILINNNKFLRVGIEPTTAAIHPRHCAPCTTMASVTASGFYIQLNYITHCEDRSYF